MKHSDSIAKLAAALVAAQAEMEAVAMDAVNPHFKNRYASLDNIIETIRPTLAKHGLAVVQGTTTPESDASAKVTGFTVETMLVHASGEWLSNAVVMPLGKADPQGAGGALTYGRRYGLSALLSLSADEDDDGNGATKQAKGGGRQDGRASNDARQSAQSGTHTTTAATAQPTASSADQFVMQFGRSKGKKLGELSTETLQGIAEWITEHSLTKKHADVMEAIGIVLGVREDQGQAA